MLSKEDWDRAQAAGEYHGTLDTEGFIHCSTPEQVIATANRYYRARKDLLLLWIDPEKLKSEVHWEASHDQIYPHIYGPLNPDAVERIAVFLPDRDGEFRHLPGE
jgi:uncharacterized protein (DUF952 family)